MKTASYIPQRKEPGKCILFSGAVAHRAYRVYKVKQYPISCVLLTLVLCVLVFMVQPPYLRDRSGHRIRTPRLHRKHLELDGLLRASTVCPWQRIATYHNNPSCGSTAVARFHTHVMSAGVISDEH